MRPLEWPEQRTDSRWYVRSNHAVRNNDRRRGYNQWTELSTAGGLSESRIIFSRPCRSESSQDNQDTNVSQILDHAATKVSDVDEFMLLKQVLLHLNLEVGQLLFSVKTIKPNFIFHFNEVTVGHALKSVAIGCCSVYLLYYLISGELPALSSSQNNHDERKRSWISANVWYKLYAELDKVIQRCYPIYY